MAFKRSTLKAMGIEDEKIDQIMEMHGETVDTLKAQRDEYKEKAEQFDDVQKQLNTAKSELESAKKDSWKVKYDAIKEEFDTYKSDTEAKETRRAKEAAFRELLKEVGVAEKRIAVVLRASDMEKVTLKDGKIENADELKNEVKTEWADFIVAGNQTGVNNSNPPNNAGGKKYSSKEEIYAIKDRAERQKAIADNADLFGIN